MQGSWYLKSVNFLKKGSKVAEEMAFQLQNEIKLLFIFFCFVRRFIPCYPATFHSYRYMYLIE